MRPRLQFSLRLLVLAVAIVPAAIYWLALPTLNAGRYVAAINSDDYTAADKLCENPRQPFPGEWAQHATFQPRAHLSPLNWADVQRSERRIYVAIAYGDRTGIASCGVECTATRRGIRVDMFLP